MKRHIVNAFLPISLLIAAAPAHAHHAMGGRTPSTFFEGFLSGLAHPVIGIDHFAFLLVVGLLAARLAGAARFIVPGAFVAATLGGTALHVGAADLPLAELAIALSVLLGGALVVLRRALPALLLGAGAALFGVFHGYAYGESIVGAEATPLFSYLLGFSLIQYAIVSGVVLGMARLAARSARAEGIAQRTGGALAAVTGGAFLLLNLA